MNVSFDDIRGEVLPGGHLVARVPGIVVVIRRDEGAGQASSADLLAPDPAGRRRRRARHPVGTWPGC